MQTLEYLLRAYRNNYNIGKQLKKSIQENKKCETEIKLAIDKVVGEKSDGGIWCILSYYEGENEFDVEGALEYLKGYFKNNKIKYFEEFDVNEYCNQYEEFMLSEDMSKVYAEFI